MVAKCFLISNSQSANHRWGVLGVFTALHKASTDAGDQALHLHTQAGCKVCPSTSPSLNPPPTSRPNPHPRYYLQHPLPHSWLTPLTFGSKDPLRRTCNNFILTLPAPREADSGKIPAISIQRQQDTVKADGYKTNIAQGRWND